MSEISDRLSLPYLMPAQAQKHVTHNEALRRLDVLVQLSVETFDAYTPPPLPQSGEIYALGAAPTGAWAGQGDKLAAWIDDGWHYFTPEEGWQALDKSTGKLRRRDATAWVDVTSPDLTGVSGVGVNTTYDATNRLSVASPATLFSHDGADHHLKVNKNAASDTASLLFQTGYAGRAEMGIAGSDDFAIKVSADGSAWTNCLSFDAATGQASGDAVTQAVDDATVGRLMRVNDFGIGQDAGIFIDDLDAHPLSGFYASYGGAHAQAPVGANPFPEMNGALGLVSGNSMQGSSGQYRWQIAFGFATSEIAFRSQGSGAWNSWHSFWSTANTTVDSNGFIKEASPIVRLFSNRTEEPALPLDAGFIRVAKGEYRLSGVPRLAQKGWQVETPQDENGNRLVFVETQYDQETETLLVWTRAMVWNGKWTGGEPQDIPNGRWVDLRFDEI